MARIDDVTATRVVTRGGKPAKLQRGLRLRIEEPGTPPRTIERRESAIRFGTRDENEVVLRDPSVSRLHAELAIERDLLRVRDLGSSNGTSVDGVRVLDAFVRNGARLELGHTAITVELLDEVEVTLSGDARLGELVGGSVAMRELFARVTQVASSDATVLITGESGTGKELVARALHDASPRAKHELVVFDCASVAANLVEAELFGHERGAFTGAQTRRSGAIEEADGGTLFLDEIGELPLDLQPKLLRVLERRELKRIGSSRWEPVDLRVVAATHRDLAAMVNRGEFREDLYYRLAVIEVRVPSLREHREDLPALVRTLLERATRGDTARARRAFDGLSRESWARLEAHPFPGNVRELRNLVERLLVLGDGAVPRAPLADAASPPASGRSPEKAAESANERQPTSSSEATSLRALVDPTRPWMEQKRALVGELEQTYLRAVLDHHGGNISQAAAAAGIERMYFKRLVKKHDG